MADREGKEVKGVLQMQATKTKKTSPPQKRLTKFKLVTTLTHEITVTKG
jgi:hypothetical protein